MTLKRVEVVFSCKQSFGYKIKARLFRTIGFLPTQWVKTL